MTTSWLIVLGEFAVFFTCAYWYLHRSRECSFAVRVEHDSIEGMTLGKVGNSSADILPSLRFLQPTRRRM